MDIDAQQLVQDSGAVWSRGHKGELEVHAAGVSALCLCPASVVTYTLPLFGILEVALDGPQCNILHLNYTKLAMCH